jgi:hypothetical protein
LAQRLGHLHLAFRLVVVAANGRDWPISLRRPIVTWSSALAVAKEMVRAEGLEPPRLTSPEPKSGASTNSATPAARAGLASRIASGGLYTSLPGARHRKKQVHAPAGSFADHGGDGDAEQASREQKARCALRALR